MTSISLPIFGQGSQPQEEDGASLEFTEMPKEMATYAMPQINADLSSPALAPVKLVLQQLQQQLANFPASAAAIDLIALDRTNRRLLDEILGEGEVSMILKGQTEIRVQESVLAGVWRIQEYAPDQQLLGDTLEAGLIPACILQLPFKDAAAQIDTNWSSLPEGVMNAPPLLFELNAKVGSIKDADAPHVINLSLLPQTEQDLLFLEQRLGQGGLTILSRGYGNCRISATAVQQIWWVQYFNSQDTLILNTLEVSRVPEVACAAAEDIADSRQRLQEIMQVYL